jgi:hypothetical protein
VTIDVLKEGWVSVPLPRGLFISDARLGDSPLPIVHPQPGAPQVILSRKGRAVVTLDLVVPVSSRAGTEQVVLPAASGLVRASVTLARPDVDVSVSGGVIVDRSATDSTSRIVAHASAGQALALAWQRKRDAQRAALPLVLRGSLQHAIGLGDEVAHVTVLVTATVVQGSASSLALDVPAGLTVNQVQGAELADWDAESRVLRITLIDPVEQETSLLVSGEFRPPASGPVAVPLVRLSGAERESGSVAVEIVGAGEVASHTARGLDEADPSELGDLMAGRVTPATVAFRYRPQPSSADRSLELHVSRYTPDTVLLATVDEARYRVLLAEDGKALVEARLAVRNNQRSFLGIRLPAGAELWSAAIDERPVRPGKGAQDMLLLPLEKKRAGEDAHAFVVRLLYVEPGAPWTASGERPLPLPAIDVPVQRTGLSLHHSPRFRLALAPGPFRVQDFESPLSQALAGLEGGGSIAGAGPVPAKAGEVQEATASGVRVETGRLTNEARLRDERAAASEVRALVDRYQRESRSARAAGVFPIVMTFPELGPRLFLATELTPEGIAPQALLTFKRTVK